MQKNNSHTHTDTHTIREIPKTAIIQKLKRQKQKSRTHAYNKTILNVPKAPIPRTKDRDAKNTTHTFTRIEKFLKAFIPTANAKTCKNEFTYTDTIREIPKAYSISTANVKTCKKNSLSLTHTNRYTIREIPKSFHSNS